MKRIVVVSDLPLDRQKFTRDSTDALRDAGHRIAVILVGRFAQADDTSGYPILASDVAEARSPRWWHVAMYPALALLERAARLFSARVARFIAETARYDDRGRQVGAARLCLYTRVTWRIWRFRPDHFHVHFAWNVRYVLPIARLLRVPVTVTVHGSDILQIAGWTTDLEDPWVRNVVCVSRFLKNTVDAEPELRQKTVVINNPIEQSFLVPVTAPPDHFVIVCIATLRPLKNHVWLFQALEVLRERGIAFSCSIVGEPLRGDEQYRDTLEEDIRRRGLSSVVHLLGRQTSSEVRRTLDAGSVLVLPSTSEGFGMCIVEALARGRVPVATDLAGCREAMDDGRLGLLVPLNDVPGLAAGLERAYKMCCMEEGGSGRTFVEERFSPERYARNMSTTMFGHP